MYYRFRKKEIEKTHKFICETKITWRKKAFTVKLLTVKLSKEPENENDEGKPLPRKKNTSIYKFVYFKNLR